MNLAQYSREPFAIGYPANLRTERNIVQSRALEALIYDDDRSFNRLDRVVQYLDKEIADAAEGVRSKPKKPKTKYTEVKNKPKKKVVVTKPKEKGNPPLLSAQEQIWQIMETGKNPYFV